MPLILTTPVGVYSVNHLQPVNFQDQFFAVIFCLTKEPDSVVGFNLDPAKVFNLYIYGTGLILELIKIAFDLRHYITFQDKELIEGFCRCRSAIL